MEEVLIEGEDLNKEGRNVWIGRGGGSSAVVILLGDVSGGNEAAETIQDLHVTH